jgi:hypothetical protein
MPRPFCRRGQSQQGFLKKIPAPLFFAGQVPLGSSSHYSDFIMTASQQHQTTTSRHTMWTCPSAFVAVAKSASVKRSAGARLIRDRHAGSAVS